MQIPRLPVSYTRQSGFKARDGHITKSFSERYVDDWLHVHMPYEHHYFYSMKGVAGNMTCDWYIPALGLHIDYWETSGNEQTNSMYLQHRFYRTNCLKAIDICEDDVLHLDSIIPARVRAVGVSCNFRKERR